MLTALSIRDIVLIEKLDISLDKGLTVLTGETGAGKSILLDSLGWRSARGAIQASCGQVPSEASSRRASCCRKRIRPSRCCGNRASTPRANL